MFSAGLPPYRYTMVGFMDNGGTAEPPWTSSDYAMDRCCALRVNGSRAFARAHAHFDAQARALFRSRLEPQPPPSGGAGRADERREEQPASAPAVRCEVQ